MTTTGENKIVFCDDDDGYILNERTGLPLFPNERRKTSRVSYTLGTPAADQLLREIRDGLGISDEQIMASLRSASENRPIRFAPRTRCWIE